MSCHGTNHLWRGRCIVETPDKYTCRLPRCIVESPDTSGNGVDFCRLPVDCASVCSQAGTRRIVMAAKIGFYHNHVNILTDRESGVVAIVNRDPSWEIYKNGIYHQQMTIGFSPALSEAHSRHGLAESRVRAVKQSIGTSDLSEFDPVSLSM